MEGALNMLLALALTLLSQTGDCSRVERARGCNGRAGGRTPLLTPQLCDVVQSGDKSGAWECLQGDGTMLTGSATTWVPTGTPTNSIEGGARVRTYVAATSQDKQPANAAFPASDFSVCQHVRYADTNTSVSFAFGANGSSAATYVFIVEQNAGHTATNLTTSNGVSATVYSPAFAFSAGTWYLQCVTYQRVGGAADNVLTMYINGSSVGTRSTEALASGLSSMWASNGYGGSVANGGNKSIRGMFITYKLLSGADITRINAAISP